VNTSELTNRAKVIAGVAHRAHLPPAKVAGLVDSMLPDLERVLKRAELPAAGAALSFIPFVGLLKGRLVPGTMQIAFDDAEGASAFLRAPHPELAGQTPLDAALTEDGAARVVRVLHALTHGLPV
jgi:hypothetical protein